MILNGLSWKQMEIIVIFEIAPKYCISDPFVHYEGYSISSKGFLPTVIDIWSSELNSPIPVHFSSLIPWVLFPLWPSLFIPSGAIGEFIFQCHIFLPFHTIHGVLKARKLKWFSIPFSSGPHFVRTLHYDPSVLGGPTRHRSWFH